MKKYCTTRNHKAFNWNKFLLKEKYTDAELEKASNFSGDWVTCACGNLCDIIPRTGGCPDDNILADLGCEFCSEICEMSTLRDFPPRLKKAQREAAKTLARIEKRAAYLIGIEMKNRAAEKIKKKA